MLSIVKKEITVKKPRESIKPKVIPPPVKVRTKKVSLQSDNESNKHQQQHQQHVSSDPKQILTTKKKPVNDSKPKMLRKSSNSSTISNSSKKSNEDQKPKNTRKRKVKPKPKDDSKTETITDKNTLKASVTTTVQIPATQTEAKAAVVTTTASKNSKSIETKQNSESLPKKIEVLKRSSSAKKKPPRPTKRTSDLSNNSESNEYDGANNIHDVIAQKPPLLTKKSMSELASMFNDSAILPIEKQSGIFEEFKEGQQQKHNVGGRSVFRHRNSISLYREGYSPGQGLEEEPIITKNGRPVFHLALNESTASFLDNSRNNTGGNGFLEMSSGLLPYHPKSKYNFKISLDDINDMSQTAAMLKDYIFDENNKWNTSRTEPNHQVPALSLPVTGDSQQRSEMNESIDQDTSFLIPSAQNSNRSFLNNSGRASTRMSFLFNKNTGLLCENCFSATCNHMEKFSQLATQDVKTFINSCDTIEANSSDITRYSSTNVSESSVDRESSKTNSVEELKGLFSNSEQNNGSESMRLVEIQPCSHFNQSAGKVMPFQELKMELDIETLNFETSTPNEEHPNVNSITNNNVDSDMGNSFGSDLLYTPAVMKADHMTSLDSRPTTNETLQYDSDYDDASYLDDCKVGTSKANCKNATFEQLDLTNGVFFSNFENDSDNNNSGSDIANMSCDSGDLSSSFSNTDNRRKPSSNSNPQKAYKAMKRKVSLLGAVPNLDTVFEGEECSARSRPSTQHSISNNNNNSNNDDDSNNNQNVQQEDLEELLGIVEDNLTNRSIDDNGDDKTDFEQTKGENMNTNIGDIKQNHVEINLKKHNNEIEESISNTADNFDNIVKTLPVESKPKHTVEDFAQDSLDEDNKTEEEEKNRRKVEDESKTSEVETADIQSAVETNNEAEVSETAAEITSAQSEETTGTPQRSFRRIQDKDGEILQHFNEDQLQLWLQANRKTCFEKDFFSDNMQYNNNKENNNQYDDNLLPEDREVLEINTPDWDKPKHKNTINNSNNNNKSDSNNNINNKINSNSKSNNNDKKETVDQNFYNKPSMQQSSTNPQQLIGVLSSESLPNTGDSSTGQPTTQGSYRHIDLLVISRDSDQEVNDGDYNADSDVYPNTDRSQFDDGSDSAIDSGVHSATLNGHMTPQTLQNDDSDTAREKDNTQSVNQSNVFSEQTLALNNQGGVVRDITTASTTISNPPVSLPIIDSVRIAKKRYNYRSTVQNNTIQENFSYYDYPREITSPMLEHHKKMAQYHRDRIELLTPLVQHQGRNSPELYYPKPPKTPPHLKKTFKRKFPIVSSPTSSGSYIENLNKVSPRTKSFVPHPPSYNNNRNKRITRHQASHYFYPHDQHQQPQHHQQQKKHVIRNPYYAEPEYYEPLSRTTSRSFHMNRQRQLMGRQVNAYTKTIDPKYDTTLYLTVPFRSLNLRQPTNDI